MVSYDNNIKIILIEAIGSNGESCWSTNKSHFFFTVFFAQIVFVLLGKYILIVFIRFGYKAVTADRIERIIGPSAESCQSLSPRWNTLEVEVIRDSATRFHRR